MLGVVHETGITATARGDIKRLFPDMARTAAHALDEAKWHPTQRAFAQANNVTQQDLINGVQAYHLFQMACSRGSDVNDAWQAFAGLNPGVYAMLFMSLGEAAAVAYWQEIRHVTPINSAPALSDLTGEDAERNAAALAGKITVPVSR